MFEYGKQSLSIRSAQGKIKAMVLYIDTTKAGELVVALKKDKQEVKKLVAKNKFGSQVLLPTIEKILKSTKIKMEDLSEIEVNTGPGSYTGIKVGVSVANALAFALNIPVNGKKIETEILYQ